MKKKVKEIVRKTIEKWIRNKEFLDIPSLFKIDENIKCVVAITFKGTGKTSSCIRYLCKNMVKKDFEWDWNRNTEMEFKKSNVYASFRHWIVQLGLDDKFKVRADGVYQVNDVKNKFDKGVLKGMFSTMSTSYNNASQNALEHCKWIVYDEVINPSFHLPFLTRDFNNLVRTMQRKNNAKIVILGNAHESDNDLLSNLGVCFDWESGKTQIIYREEQGLLAIYLERYDIKALQEADTATDRLFMYSEEVRNFNEGKVANNNTWSVINPLMIPHYKERFKPLWFYDVNDAGTIITFAVGELGAYKDIPSSDILFIEKLSTNKYADYEIPRFCYRPQDKLPDKNIYIYDLDDLSSVKYMLNKYNAGKLQFNSTFGRNYFTQHLLTYLRLFLEDEKKTKN